MTWAEQPGWLTNPYFGRKNKSERGKLNPKETFDGNCGFEVSPFTLDEIRADPLGL